MTPLDDIERIIDALQHGKQPPADADPELVSALQELIEQSHATTIDPAFHQSLLHKLQHTSPKQAPTWMALLLWLGGHRWQTFAACILIVVTTTGLFLSSDSQPKRLGITSQENAGIVMKSRNLRDEAERMESDSIMVPTIATSSQPSSPCMPTDSFERGTFYFPDAWQCISQERNDAGEARYTATCARAATVVADMQDRGLQLKTPLPTSPSGWWCITEWAPCEALDCYGRLADLSSEDAASTILDCMQLRSGCTQIR